MNSKRCYKQYCGLAKALDVIGERWTLLILRDLLLGPWRYSDLMERMPGITSNLLAKRLKDMEGNDLIKKTLLSSIGSSHVYEITKLGRQLQPAMLALNQFGVNFMLNGPESDEQVDAGRALLNLIPRYRGKQKGVLEFAIHDNPSQNLPKYFLVTYSAKSVDIHHGKHFSPETTTVELPLTTYADMAFRNENTAELEKQGKIKITGDIKMWKRFLDSFGFH